MKLIINRNKWLRGEGPELSKLLREKDGKMCCLGFYGLACGLSEERISDIESPPYTPRRASVGARSLWGEGDWLFEDSHNPSNDCSELMTVNDEKSMSPEDRESEIQRIFALHNVEVEFVDQ